MKELILHIDILQPESRAILSFCKMASISYMTRSYSVLKNEHKKSAELVKKNPSLTIPFMESEKICLSGAHTIMRYLCNTRCPKDNVLYPSDPVSRAKVDMMLDWHLTTAQICSKLVWSTWLGQNYGEYFSLLVTPQKLFPRDVHISLKMMNTDWLPKKMIGAGSLHLGDIILFHE